MLCVIRYINTRAGRHVVHPPHCKLDEIILGGKNNKNCHFINILNLIHLFNYFNRASEQTSGFNTAEKKSMRTGPLQVGHPYTSLAKVVSFGRFILPPQCTRRSIWGGKAQRDFI